jgi:hypothetical protein
VLAKHRTRRALRNPGRRAILKVHAITRRQSTLLAVEDLAGWTSRPLNRKTLLGLLAVDGAGLANGALLRDTFLAIEPHPGRADRLFGVSAVLAVELQPWFAPGHRTNAFLTIEVRVSRTLRFALGDALPIEQGVTWFALCGDKADTPPVGPLVVGRALRVLWADALLAVEDCALYTDGDADDAAASDEGGDGGAGRDEAGDAVAVAIGDRAGGAGRGDSGDADGTVEDGVLLAGGKVAGGVVIVTLGVVSVGDAVGAVEGEAFFALGAGEADAEARLKFGVGRAAHVDGGDAVLAGED